MKSKWTNRILVGALAVLVMVLGVTAVFAQSTDTTTPETDTESDTLVRPGHGGAFDGHAIGKGDSTYLADALGITVEELDAAYDAARVAAIEQAVEAGLLTQEQADWILSGEALGMHGFGFKDFGHLGIGPDGADEAAIDNNALLADALGITVDELDTARAEAKDAAIAQALADGTITQEQVDLMEARAALKDVIDDEAIMADVLGISVEDLQAARQDRTAMAQLLEDSGLTATEFMEALQAAHADAVQQAVDDGIITQEQADLLSANGFDGFHGAGGRGHHGHGERGFGGGRGLQGDLQDGSTGNNAPAVTTDSV